MAPLVVEAVAQEPLAYVAIDVEAALEGVLGSIIHILCVGKESGIEN